uniref:Uncharacterized protein n=1 Tax=Haptolina ericina TaxID=156174 RepID=A0A7S3FI31_9EUKA
MPVVGSPGVLLAEAKGLGLSTVLGALHTATNSKLRELRSKPARGLRAQERNVLSAAGSIAFEGTSILTAAVIDVLINSNDRSVENIFISDGGEVMVIDTEDGSLEYHGPPNSAMIPGTPQYEGARRAYLGGDAWVGGLDYRCHTRDGKLGNQFPPQLRECLVRVADRSAFSPQSLGHNDSSAFRQRCCQRSVCVPEQLPLRARELLVDGMEAVLERLVPGFRDTSLKQPSACPLRTEAR